MGWEFSLQDANIVGYLTSADPNFTPRVTQNHLGEFLNGIVKSIRYKEHNGFISSDIEWTQEILTRTEDALNRFGMFYRASQSEEEYSSSEGSEGGAAVLVPQKQLLSAESQFLSAEALTIILNDLKKLFSNYQLYGLAIGNPEGELWEISKSLAESLGENGLILMPVSGEKDAWGNRINRISFLDPFPAISLLAEEAVSFPGMLFWTRTGVIGYFTQDEADELRKTGELKTIEQAQIDFQKISERRQKSETKKILHISDLHFGTDYAIDNRTRLKNEIRAKSKTFHRVVITGDLFDNPKSRDAKDFNDFRNDLFHITGKEIIVIPGNHDQKSFGNNIGSIGRDLKELAALEWSNIVIDDDLKCVFFCFDSAREASIAAMGKFSNDEKNSIENEFNTKRQLREELEHYQRIALIHHHPFKFELGEIPVQPEESWFKRGVDKVKSWFSEAEEHFLSMENADDFLQWCANMRIPLILHGHEHYQRHHYRSFRVDSSESFFDSSNLFDVTAVGCGTSLGMGDFPLTYNILSWNETSRKWGTTFVEDKKDGRQFKTVKVDLKKVD